MADTPRPIPFEPFNQPGPELGNQYDDDRVLRSYIHRVLPEDVRRDVEPELREMGELAGGELRRLQVADRPNEPQLTQWSPWGERIDRIELTAVWKRAHEVAAEKGVVATAYERKHGALSRVHQFALAYLFTPPTDTFGCPLAMTDGAARTLLDSHNRQLIDRAVPHLTSRDPKQMWTSGQWMTESTGGSDVGRSETLAKQDAHGQWRLYGRKWFTSAATSEMALTLGRPEGNPEGGHGLAMFYVETGYGAGDGLRNIRLARLKDKLGTRKLPTAELFLEGTPAELVKDTTGGVRDITPMLNITRTWNAVTAVSSMRHGIALARDYAQRRVAFGTPLSEKPLHLDTLAGMQAEMEAAFHLTFFVVELLGRMEAGELDEAGEKLLRLSTPIVKLVTAKQTVAVSSEVLEAFGGAGYVEDTGLPALLRDSQVLSIWEGTTNVLALDTLRAMARGAGLEGIAMEVDRCAEEATDPELRAAAEVANKAVSHAEAWVHEAMKEGQQPVEAGARRFALTLGRALELALLVRHAQWALEHEQDRRPRAAALRFARSGIDLVTELGVEDSRALAL